jgi:hypothetical protein
MWNYSGSTDPTRVSTEDVLPADLKKVACRLTYLTKDDDLPITYRVALFGKEHPTPAQG